VGRTDLAPGSSRRARLECPAPAEGLEGGNKLENARLVPASEVEHLRDRAAALVGRGAKRRSSEHPRSDVADVGEVADAGATGEQADGDSSIDAERKGRGRHVWAPPLAVHGEEAQGGRVQRV